MRRLCNWPVDVCEECCAEALEGLPDETREALEQAAASFLWAATGRRYGLCEVTLRPCRRDCLPGSGLPSPSRVGGQWVNLACGSCPGQCGCGAVSEVILDNVAEVIDVTVDGEELDPFETVAVYDNRRVVRTDGGQWPACQDLSTVDGPGTWSLTILQGLPVPPGGEFVAGLLLCELAKACRGDDSCALPRRVQTVTREGVTIGFQDQFESLGHLRTGIWEIDSWIEAARTTQFLPPTITSLDVPRPAELTWPLPEHYPDEGEG